jgi:Ca-activated chloride channel family protein
MKRWHLTFGLTSLAIGAAFLAPRLVGRGWSGEVPPPEPPVVPEVPPVADVVPDEVPGIPAGHLVVDAGLDRTAVLRGDDAERYLTVTVTAPLETGRAVRRPVDLAVVMDTSGSMSARGKIDQARRAAKLLAAKMEPGDTYSLTVFNDDATVVVPATQVDDPTAIQLAIDRIYEGGGTNLYAGMDRGAREVRRSLREGTASRVVVLSDGNANVGVTDDNALVRFAADLAGDGIALSTVGLGLEYNEDLLARLSDVGGGTYDFVDDASQLESVFSDELARVASVVARGTTVHVKLPKGVVPVEVIGWDARPVGDGWDVYLGEVWAGDTKKIVTRVKIDGRLADGEHPVADVGAAYVDVVDGIDALATDTASVLVTGDRGRVAASVDRERSIEASRAVGSQFLDLSTRAYAQGERERSKDLAEQAVRTLRTTADALGDTTLQRDADEILDATHVYEMHAPTSSEGRTQIKLNKERFRDLAR